MDSAGFIQQLAYSLALRLVIFCGSGTAGGNVHQAAEFFWDY